MSDEKFLAELAAKFERETQVYLGYVNVDRAEKVRAIAARLAALTAENERLKSALTNIKGAARALLNPGEWRDGDVQVYPAAKAHAILAIIAANEAAALPSSRETTDGGREIL